MTASSSDAPRRPAWRRPFEAWLDGIEAGWAIPVLLSGFVALWTAFLIIAYLNADLHPDVLEAWSVGRDLSWGNAKHPPLMGWIAYGWSRLFPIADWSFQLLAMVNAALALWAVDLTARRFVRGDKRVVVLLLLMLLPAYQFHAQRFNANTVLLAVWPLAIYCFLRAFETRAAGWSLAAGVLCAAAMLGKYYSIFLIVSFGFAALMHPRRRLYLCSPAPWISAGAGLLVLAPHLYWLATNAVSPFEYAMHAQGGVPFTEAVHDAAMFLLGQCAYFLIPAIAFVLMTRTRLRDYVQDLRRLDPGLVLLGWIFAGTLIFPVLTGVTLGTALPSLWNFQALFMVVVVAVCATRFPIARFDTVNLTVCVLVFGAGALIAAPIHALYRNAHPFNENRHFLSLAAAELTRTWHEAYGVKLPRVSGNDALAFAAAFYSPDHPAYSRPFRLQYQWSLPRPATLRKGWSAMCFADDTSCMRWMERVQDMTRDVRRFDFVVTASLWGRPGASKTVMAMMAPPVESGDGSAEPPQKLHDDGVEDLSIAAAKPQRHSGAEPSRVVGVDESTYMNVTDKNMTDKAARGDPDAAR